MRIRVQGCALVVLFLLGLPAFAVEPAHDAARLEQVVAAQQGRATVQGRLRWMTSRVDDPATPAREQHVRFFLAFPDRYALVVTKPGDDDSKQSFISDGRTRWEVMQLFADEQPEKKAVPVGEDEVEQRLLACFRFDLVRLRQDFAIVAVPAGEGTVITLTPAAEKLKQQLIVLVLTFDAKHQLTAIRSEDPQGNRFDFAVLEAVYDQPLDDALFQVRP